MILMGLGEKWEGEDCYVIGEEETVMVRERGAQASGGAGASLWLQSRFGGALAVNGLLVLDSGYCVSERKRSQYDRTLEKEWLVS